MEILDAAPSPLTARKSTVDEQKIASFLQQGLQELTHPNDLTPIGRVRACKSPLDMGKVWHKFP